MFKIKVVKIQLKAELDSENEIINARYQICQRNQPKGQISKKESIFW